MRQALLLVLAGVAACHTATPLPVSAGLAHASPATLGFDSLRLAASVTYLRAEVDSGAFPGAVLAVGRHGRLALVDAVGHYGVDDARPVDVATLYDLASVTKVVTVTTICMELVDEGKLGLDDPVERYLPQFRGAHKDAVTIRDLLTHTSGLPAWRPLYREVRSRRAALALVDTTPLENPPGAKYVYSDLGAIVLMQVVERLTGARIDSAAAVRVFEPLGMAVTRFRPPASWRPHIAPTELDTTFRRHLLVGEVHDANAGLMDGISGHAGLFSNALDLSRFAAMLLAGGILEGKRLIRTETVAEFTRRQDTPPGSSRALGWDTPDEPRTAASSAGLLLSARSFGHTGFTGTSLWMDPDRDLFIILLTNRVNARPVTTAIRQVRSKVADLVMDALTDPNR